MIYHYRVWERYFRKGETEEYIDTIFFSKGTNGSIRRTLSLHRTNSLSIHYIMEIDRQFRTMTVFKPIRICDE